MLASELIKQLESAVERHGNFSVSIHDGSFTSYTKKETILNINHLAFVRSWNGFSGGILFTEDDEPLLFTGEPVDAETQKLIDGMLGYLDGVTGE